MRFDQRASAIIAAAAAATVLAIGSLSAAPQPKATVASVRVWEGSMALPTYDEGPPDVNAPFDIFANTRFSYPYTLRNGLTATRTSRTWRTLNLENEYLRCVILPDLGGHLYTCVDKVNGRDLFYANTAIKFANIAYRGAWAALGIEFNFPVSHNWMTVSPVDYAIVRNGDGSASVWVGNIDRVYGGQWRVELTLRPHRAVLEQHTSLYNRSASRHRFYWWTNAAVRVQDDTRILYPTRYTAAHGFATVDTWPVDARGVDLSVVRTHTTGPVSLFSHGSHEPFMAIYHPSSQSGVVHYSAPIDLPAKKFWSWGSDADGLDWRIALSDDKSAYVEVQAGLFRNQETYEFIEPQETISFTEYWLPLRDIGGMVRATPDAALNLTRTSEDATHVTLNAAFTVTRPVANGHLRLSNGTQVIANEPLTTDPSRVVRRTFPHLPGDAHYTIELSDARGMLVSHTEDTYDLVPDKEITKGPQQLPQLPPASEQSDAQVVEAGRVAELDGRLLDADRVYEGGLERAPDSFVLNKAAGRLAVRLKRPDEALARLTRAERRISNDPEVEYYLGQAFLQNDDLAHARPHFILAQQRSAFRAAARFELARLDARAGALDRAAQLLAEIGTEFPDAVRPGQAHIAVLRHLGRKVEAKRLLDAWRRIDPTNSGLRYEAVLATADTGARDTALWTHLAADPDRLIEISADYFGLGFFDDAATLLARTLPHGADVISEPGTPAADANPLIAYYRAYARQRAGGHDADAKADFEAARRLPTTYIFPQRWETGRVLEAALAHDAGDATAQFLLGSWYLSGGRVQQALQAWNATRAIDANRPGLHRNLGLTLLHALDKPADAADVLREGTKVDPQNTGIYVALDQALSLTDHPAGERAEALSRYPNLESAPALVAFRLALALAEAGRFDDAERVFAHRFFAREEGGTNVRQVYLEVRLLRARDAATHGRCDEALTVLDGLSAPVADLAFTRDGLPLFLETGRFRYERGSIEAACGRRDAARAHWESVLKTEVKFPFVDSVFAYRSAQRLCDLANDAAECRASVNRAWTPRIEQALGAATRQIDVIGTSVPGAIRNAQGLLLAALGHDAEARQRFREALQANDAMLSHHLAREGLAALSAH